MARRPTKDLAPYVGVGVLRETHEELAVLAIRRRMRIRDLLNEIVERGVAEEKRRLVRRPVGASSH